MRVQNSDIPAHPATIAGTNRIRMMTDLLRSAREARGLTQDQVAKAVGVSRATYVSVESGKVSPRLDEAKSIASVLGVPLDVLAYGPGADGVAADPEKYKQVLLNCAKYGADADGRITKTKLAKLAYLADFAWFYEKLEPMTGLKYRRLPQGPVPDAFFSTVDDLFEEKSVAVAVKGQAILISCVEEPGRSRLSDAQLKVIRAVCAKWKGRRTQEIVDFTHAQLPWKVCRPNEVIPYELITQQDPAHVY